MSSKLQVEIGAEISGLTTGLKKGEEAVTKFGKSAGGVGVSAMGSLTRSSNQAGFALTNLGRVAQDAPYGFIGIQNNLNPLLESFQQLKKETGSSSAAFKALGASLIGPAGLGIALSVVSAAVLFYQQYQQKANSEAKNAKKATDDYAASLDGVTGAQLKGAQAATKELVSLKSLYTATQNTSISLVERKRAVDELQSQFPAYFGNLSDESILAGKASAAYDKLTISILASARARAAEDRIVKNANRQLENEQKSLDIQTANNKLIKEGGRLKNIIKTNPQQAQYAASALAKIEEKIGQNIGVVNNLRTDGNILTKENLRLEQEILKNQIKGGAIRASGGKITGGITKTGTAGTERDPHIALVDDINVNDLTRRFAQKTKDLIGKGEVKGFTIDVAPVVPTGPLFATGEIIKEYFQYDIVPQLQSGFNTFFNDALTKGELSFKTLGDSIKNTFASVLANEATQGLMSLLSGGKGAAGKNGGGLFALLGSALGMAKKTSGTGVASILGSGILPIGTAAAATGGGTAAALAGGTAASGGLLLPILGGIAAIAGIASLFKKKKVDTPNSSYSPSPTFTNTGGNSNSSTGGQVVFKIHGSQLIGVLNNAGKELASYKV